MDTKALRQKILDLAIRGKLVPQDPNDEPASVLLERIRAEKQQMVKDGKLKAKDIKNDSVIFVGEDSLHYEKFADGTVKCIEDEIPFELPDGWEWCRLNHIYNFIDYRGATPNKTSVGVPLVTAKNVKFGYIDYTIDEYISKEEYLQRQQRGVSQKGDILFTTEAPLGNVAIADLDIFSAGQRLITFQQYNESTNLVNDLFMFFIMSGFFQQQLQTNKTGSTVAGIKAAILKNLWMPVPPVNEQQQIVDFCKALFKHIEDITNNRDNVIKLVGAIKSKILDLAIRGRLVPQDPNDEPASVLLERIRAEKEELIKQGKIKRDKKESVIFKGEDNSYYLKTSDNKSYEADVPFDLPDNWEWVCLADIAQVLNGDRGQNYPAKNKLQKFGIPFVSASDIVSGKVSSENLLCMTETQYNALGAGKLLTGDIVYCIRGSLGKCGFFEMKKGAIASSLVIVRPLVVEKYVAQYIFNFLNSNLAKQEIKKYDNGSAQPNLAAKDFMRFFIPLPPLEELKRIVLQLEIVFKCLDSIFNILS